MIPIKNVYYMLSYAFRVLNEQGYKRIETEKFDNVADLCASILINGISMQIKRGMVHEYITETGSLISPKGKIDVTASIKQLSTLRGQLVCNYDEFSVNSYMNRIIKTTLILLLSAKVSAIRKKAIKKLLIYFGGIEVLDFHTIDWTMRFNKNNQNYRMLISICKLVIKGLIQSKSDGSTVMMDFFDEQKMHRLYEKFIFEYYNVEYKHLNVKTSANMMDWQVDDGFCDFLPKMKTDISLTYRNRTLIIDAKYYENNLREQFGKLTIPSDNLYQIFTYVKTKENQLQNTPHEKVAGMLLYAQTEEGGALNNEYKIMGNRICVRTLDLNKDFVLIKEQLDDIISKYLLFEGSF